MAYNICKRCNVLFEGSGRSYCSSCLEKHSKDQDLIIEYVKRHPGSTVIDIIVDTGVTLKSINLLVEEGYVSYVNNGLETVDNQELTNKIKKLIDTGSRFHLKGSLE